MSISILEITPTDHKDWLQMAQNLWQDYSAQELKDEPKAIIKNPDQVIFMVKQQRNNVGFLYLAARKEYVEGAETSPVGYIEGIYLNKPQREKGTGKQLINYAEEWTLAKGYKELASDTWFHTKDSQAFHESVGFTKADTIVHYVKSVS